MATSVLYIDTRRGHQSVNYPLDMSCINWQDITKIDTAQQVKSFIDQLQFPKPSRLIPEQIATANPIWVWASGQTPPTPRPPENGQWSSMISHLHKNTPIIMVAISPDHAIYGSIRAPHTLTASFHQPVHPVLLSLNGCTQHSLPAQPPGACQPN